MKNRYWLHILLFIVTFFTCAIAGVLWSGKPGFNDLANIHYGLQYAALLMGFLTAHEFGHYFAAKIHKVQTTLPFYIPIPPTPFMPLSFGTMGAVIKINEPIPNKKALFDIGVSGPIAGFIVCLIYLIYGFTHLPGYDFIYNIHPEALKAGLNTKGLYFGDNLLFSSLQMWLAPKNMFIPPMSEVYHYPFLCVGWFGLFVTSLNLLPIGQLDGGHLTYSMFGEKAHAIIARVVWFGLIAIGLAALIQVLSETMAVSEDYDILSRLNNGLYYYVISIKNNFSFIKFAWLGWLFWAVFTRFIAKLDHPPVYDNAPIGAARMAIGIFAIIIFLISFSINGIYFLE